MKRKIQLVAEMKIKQCHKFTSDLAGFWEAKTYEGIEIVGKI